MKNNEKNYGNGKSDPRPDPTRENRLESDPRPDPTQPDPARSADGPDPCPSLRTLLSWQYKVCVDIR